MQNVKFNFSWISRERIFSFKVQDKNRNQWDGKNLIKWKKGRNRKKERKKDRKKKRKKGKCE